MKPSNSNNPISVGKAEEILQDTSVNVNAALESLKSGMRNINLENAITQYKDVVESSAITKTGDITQLPADKLRGFVLEAHGKGSYNIDAAAKGVSELSNAKIGGDVLSDGTVMSPHDQVNDIMIETKDTLRQQLGNDDPKLKGYQAKAYKDADATQKALSDYDTNHLGPSDHVNSNAVEENVYGKKVSSDPITDEELYDLAERAKKGQVEYSEEQAESKKNQLRKLNFKNAVKYGAIAGALSRTTLEIVEFLRDNKELNTQNIQKSLKKILLGAADGSARGGLIYLSSEVFSVSGTSAIPVLAGTNVIYDFAKDLYLLSEGEIDADDLLCNTVNNAFTSTASFAGVQLGASVGGMAVQTSIGQAIGLGATVGSAGGPLGVIIGGAIFGLISGIGSSLIVSKASKEGFQRVQTELNQISSAANLDPSLTKLKLIEQMGQLSPKESFSYKSLIPMYNIIGDLAEYRQRKKVLKNIRSNINEARKNLDSRFNQAKEELISAHQERCQQLEQQFKKTRHQIASDSFKQFKLTVAEDYQNYQQAYAFTFGNIQLEYEKLKEQQERHESLMKREKERRRAQKYLINLLQDISKEESNEVIDTIIVAICNEINKDESLNDFNYIHRSDILGYLKRGNNIVS